MNHLYIDFHANSLYSAVMCVMISFHVPWLSWSWGTDNMPVVPLSVKFQSCFFIPQWQYFQYVMTNKSRLDYMLHYLRIVLSLWYANHHLICFCDDAIQWNASSKDTQWYWCEASLTQHPGVCVCVFIFSSSAYLWKQTEYHCGSFEYL